MPNMTTADLAAAAVALEKATANIHLLIQAEGKKIGDRHGITYAKAATEQIKEHAAEFRRMRKALDRLGADARWALSAGTYSIDACSVLKIVVEAISPAADQVSANEPLTGKN